MKTKYVLAFLLLIMAGMIIFAVFFRAQFIALLNRPLLYSHARFVHIAGVTLFFANAVLGIIWESRALVSMRKEVILHTYSTVSWLDARLSSPLIIVSVISGIMLSIIKGDMMKTGWMSWGFVLFLLSGLLWVITDIPTQRKINMLMEKLDPSEESLTPELYRLLRIRLWVSLGDILPLVIVFILMVYKPEIPALGALFK